MCLDATPGADGRKSTEWFLEPRYYNGVESTTRYRKGNNRGSGRASRGAAARLAAEGTAHSLSRVAAGRKGGYQAAQNRKKVKAEQQHQAAAARQQARHIQNNNNRHQHHQQAQQRHPQIHQLQRLAVPQYLPGEYSYSSHNNIEYAANHPQQSSSSYQAEYGIPAIRGPLGPAASENHYLDPHNRNLDLNNNNNHNYFHSQELGVGGGYGNVNKRCSRVLQGDNDQATEPTTPPPGTALDSPMEDLSLGSKHPQDQGQQPYLVPEMVMATTGQGAGFASYHHHHHHHHPAVVTTVGGVGVGVGYAQYSLADTIVYEPPSGHQSPLFTDRLGAEDAALFAAGAGWDESGLYYE